MTNLKRLKLDWDNLVEKKNLGGNEALRRVKQDGHALEYVPKNKITEEIIIEAMKQKGYVLRLVPESKMTEEIIIEAVKQDSYALRFVPNSFWGAVEEICKELGRVIKIIK